MRATLVAFVGVLLVGCAATQPRRQSFGEQAVENAKREMENARKEYEEPATDLGAFTVEGVARSAKRTTDEYRGTVTLESPEVYSGWSRNRSRAVLIQSSPSKLPIILRVYTISFDGWNFFSTAYLLGGTKLQVEKIRSGDVSCAGGGPCENHEQHAVLLTDAVLKDGAVSGLAIQLSGRQQIEVKIPAALVAGFLRRVEEERRIQKPAPPEGS